ncbi:IucA/IucC family siderophore biosynthesis protein [Phytohabitans flavus]|uniref:Iron transporter n=1 Tax=Phytohabitans flavus TaxID=1076124 RepID=A0A6F8XQE1_9ACTN|nr:IucA/IucC family siderophore biosynthesis protein [Phytohabitans flavus]BCB76009.1 iron transporter [Phytohabitans flavus]
MHAPDPAATLSALDRDRPDLVTPFEKALPGARSAVLARLWGAYAREPVPGLLRRSQAGNHLTVHTSAGQLTGPADAAEPYAVAADGLTIHLDTVPYTDPAALARALGHEGFAVEVDNSAANLALARAAAPDRQPTLTGTLPELEQSVVDGHPLHPCCRTRLGMSTLDVLRYAPEHRPIVRLHVVRVPPARWYGDGPPLLLVHPWQREHVLDTYRWLTPVGRVPARPLMSLRTMAPAGGTHHVKTAVDVQMTSAVRTVSPAAIHNGPAVGALLAALAPPGLEVMAEDRGGAVLVDGEPSRSLAYLRRRLPRLDAGEVAVPLASLAAAVRAGHRLPDPIGFFTALAGVLLTPLLHLLHRGIALEAHGQNTLVVLRDGRPTRLLYRDFGGVRVSPAMLRRHGVEPPPLYGDVATDDPEALRAKLLAAAVSGTLAEQVAAFSRAYGIMPALLWSRAARPELRDGPLPVKATTAMRLASDPLTDVWASLPNPMAG